MNVVKTSDGLHQVQGTAEAQPFNRAELDSRSRSLTKASRRHGAPERSSGRFFPI